MQYLGQTIAEICEATGQKTDTVQKRFRRKMPGRTFSQDMRPDAVELEILFPTDRKRRSAPMLPVYSHSPVVKRKQPVSTSQPPEKGSDSKAKEQVSLSDDFVFWLKCIIYGHSALVAWDLWALYKEPGIIAALIAVMFKHAAVKLAQSGLNRSSLNALIACFVIDALCAWIHYLAFRLSIDRLESLSENVALWTSAVLAGFVVSASFYSLFLIRDAKPDAA